MAPEDMQRGRQAGMQRRGNVGRKTRYGGGEGETVTASLASGLELAIGCT